MPPDSTETAARSVPGRSREKGKSDESLMVLYLEGQRQPKMPPNDPVEEADVKMVRRLIDEGAKIDVPAK